jgi:hypothetical protein
MGMCCQNNAANNLSTKYISTITNNEPANTTNNQCITSKITSFEKAETFPDMPEWDGERYKGFGIKQMKGYKCSLKIDELNSLREKFWQSKKTQGNIWKILHQACVYDHIKAEEYLFKNNIRTSDGCICQCIDDKGNYYRIPNYCINDPYFELEILPNSNGEGDEKKNIEIVLVNYAKGLGKKYTVSNDMTGEELKKLYSNDNEIDLNNVNMKVLFGGGIIKDNEKLFQYKIKNGYTIQICVFPKDN